VSGDGETLIDSGDRRLILDERYGGEAAHRPEGGCGAAAVLRVAAIMMGACDKGLQAAYHRNHTPVENAISRGSTIAWRR
jgi:hypothetical protein